MTHYRCFFSDGLSEGINTIKKTYLNKQELWKVAMKEKVTVKFLLI